ncbi:MAG: DegT/DnrJ/EryC1/StrS family aminotransferase [Bacteroidales bacterium]|nr:DegT/DnrJ/EryC1/StrS family aminotransferase [Bacteroidales bacterium]
MAIPFSPPRIDEKTLASVNEALLSGWITTGPRTKAFENHLSTYTGASNVLCVNSATAGLELILRWFGVGAGDEVIVPAYTYCATANAVLHTGATPVMVDILDDFTINPQQVRSAITPRTKVIIPVDLAGYPCNYDDLYNIVNTPDIVRLFTPNNRKQEQLNRILILSDAAHSIGATYRGKKAGCLADITVFSFHAVKNLTTAEGGAICLCLPHPFDNESIYKYLRTFSLHGQSKDALAKTGFGQWRYDVTEAGYKCNMTDIQAAIGLVELERYDEMLHRREEIFDRYSRWFAPYDCFKIPEYKNQEKTSSFHVYLLRINNITEEERDQIIEDIAKEEVATNVHFIPLPLLTLYREQGYRMSDYPKAYEHYAREISLPVYFTLSDEDTDTVARTVIESTRKIIS